MSKIAIKLQNISKKYHIGAIQASSDGVGSYKTIRESLMNLAKTPIRRFVRLCQGHAYGATDMDESIFALNDVSCEIKEGEVVGVIGRNGAGKSTLLKILSRITEPSGGCAEIHGRVGALLEVGTGFHPELTGRENIFLNGAILGMNKKEILRKFDEIVQFAEVEKFIDTPVKFYSSGMYVRLAFAVAAHLESDILLVDEVLAVGDVEFQKKCLGKMGDIAKGGRTVLFVSHNMAAIKSLCKRTIMLSDGRLLSDDLSHKVVETYLNSGQEEEEGVRYWDCSETRQKVFPEKIEVLDPTDSRVTNIAFDKATTLDFSLKVQEPLKFQVSFRIVNNDGVAIFSTEPQTEPIHYDSGTYRFRCKIPPSLLSPGRYHVVCGIHDPGREMYFLDENAISWHVAETGSSMARYKSRETGVVLVNASWEVMDASQNKIGIF